MELRKPKGAKVMIACGGTGGHIFPGIAIAQAFARIRPEIKIVFVGTRRGLESDIIPRMGFDMISIGSTSIKDRKGIGRVIAYARLPFSIMSAIGLLRKERPDALIGIGGYAAGPLTLAASIMKVPSAIVEPNAVAGFTNRILGRFVRRVYTGFPEANHFFPAGKVLRTGNPIREGITEIAKSGSTNSQSTTVFCFGGSQGALALNRAVVSALPHLASAKKKLKFIHQVGEKEDMESIRKAYKENGFEADIFTFTNSIWDCYSKANLVVSRAGATTLAEISAIGLPAILIPYPYAADDHQRVNAQSLEICGGAVVILQSELSGERLAMEINKLTPDRLAMMSAALIRQGRPDAADKIAKDCLKLIYGGEGL